VQVPGGDVIVAQVLPGTPADSAGLLAGDVVRSVGGLEAGKAGLDSMRRHFRAPGTIDTLVIGRRGTTRTVSLRQRELP
jgi:C-terminal processing protease CtpA/Prc